MEMDNSAFSETMNIHFTLNQETTTAAFQKAWALAMTQWRPFPAVMMNFRRPFLDQRHYAWLISRDVCLVLWWFRISVCLTHDFTTFNLIDISIHWSHRYLDEILAEFIFKWNFMNDVVCVSCAIVLITLVRVMPWCRQAPLKLFWSEIDFYTTYMYIALPFSIDVSSTCIVKGAPGHQKQWWSLDNKQLVPCCGISINCAFQCQYN